MVTGIMSLYRTSSPNDTVMAKALLAGAEAASDHMQAGDDSRWLMLCAELGFVRTGGQIPQSAEHIIDLAETVLASEVIWQAAQGNLQRALRLCRAVMDGADQGLQNIHHHAPVPTEGTITGLIGGWLKRCLPEVIGQDFPVGWIEAISLAADLAERVPSQFSRDKYLVTIPAEAVPV